MLLQVQSVFFKLILLIHLTIAVTGENAINNTVQITVHHSSPCEDDANCFTLPNCLLNVTTCFTSNTTILFPPGNLNTGKVEGFVVVRSIENIHLLGSNTNTVIHCQNELGVAFVNVTNITITRIQLHNCGKLLPIELLHNALRKGTTVEKINIGWTSYDSIHTTIPNTTLITSLYLTNVLNTTISHLVINGSRGFGFLSVNMLGQSTISHSTFIRSNINYDPSNCTTHSCAGGNVFIAFLDKSQTYHGIVSKLTITDTYVRHGFNVESLAFRGNGYSDIEITPSGGLTVVVLYKLSYVLNVTVHKSILDSNSGPQGANCALLVYDYFENFLFINISQTYITNGNVDRSDYFTSPVKSGGVHIFYGLDNTEEGTPDEHKNVILITNSIIARNAAFYGAALTIIFHGVDTAENIKVQVLIINTMITNNSASISVVYIYGFISSFHREKNRNVVFIRTTIKNNRLSNWLTDYKSLEKFNTTVHIQNPPSLCTMTNSTIKNNQMQGMKIDNVRRLNFHLDNYVSGNIGINGGGIQLHRSQIFLIYSARLFIENNNAVKGGGLYYEDKQPDFGSCFFHTTFFWHKFQIIFKNNTAKSSGNSIYGNIRLCYTAYYLVPTREVVVSFKRILIPWNNSLTEVASDIHQLCFCVDEIPQCHINNWEKDSFPGELVTVSSVAVGDLNGTVPGVAIAYTVNDPFNDIKQEAQQLGTVCGNLSYRVYGREQSLVKFYLQTSYEQTIRPTNIVILTLSVTLKTCPIGFEQSNQTSRQTCDCISFLSNIGVTCNIDNNSFQTTGQVWVGFDNKSEQFLSHESCPFDNCHNNVTTKFTLNTTNLQCAFKHSGLLCGGCHRALSAVLGSNRCLECSNSHIALLIVFLAAGIVLVMTMIYCDITLSKGTLNGLIFYANIVQVNRTVLFPQGERNILTVFIAWFNLDLGIETCFYNGMDAYGRTWLQYLFPVYIWIITIFVIIASWHSTTAAKVLLNGKNAVAVLATLLLLSYTKLQRTVLESWSFTLIYMENGNSFPVWLYDGNVPFFGAKHAVLFVAAIIVVATFLFPYTFIVLCEKLMLAKCGRVVTKFNLKPFLDAYHGAYKTKYRWWTGFMLLVRSALILAFATNILGSPKLNLFLVIIACTGVLTFRWNLGTIYKQRVVSLIESFYLQNLILLALSTIYISNNSDSPIRDQKIASYLLVGLAFLVFLIIAGYHIFIQMKAFKNSPYWCIKKKEVNESSSESFEEALNSLDAENSGAKLPTVSYVELNPTDKPKRRNRMKRESLLFETDT